MLFSLLLLLVYYHDHTPINHTDTPGNLTSWKQGSRRNPTLISYGCHIYSMLIFIWLSLKSHIKFSIIATCLLSEPSPIKHTETPKSLAGAVVMSQGMRLKSYGKREGMRLKAEWHHY